MVRIMMILFEGLMFLTLAGAFTVTPDTLSGQMTSSLSAPQHVVPFSSHSETLKTASSAVSSTSTAMAPRKKYSEMTQEEKKAESERNDLLLKLKGAAFVVGCLAYYLSQQ